MRFAVQFFFFALILTGCGGSTLAAATTPQQTLQAAARVLEETRELKVRAIPESLLADAQAVAVVPNVVKVGLIVGGRHGRGVVVTRERDGSWSAPTFVELSGGSVGWQLGVQSTDVVLVFKNKQGIDTLLNGNKFTLGADAAVAAGPVGRQASAATDEQLKAEVYSYSRSRGLFAGVALDGSVMSIDAAATSAYQQGGEAAVEDVTRFMAALDPLASAKVPAAQDADSAKEVVSTRNLLVDSYTRLDRRLPADWRSCAALPGRDRRAGR